jgi:hypothetical protein
MLVRLNVAQKLPMYPVMRIDAGKIGDLMGEVIKGDYQRLALPWRGDPAQFRCESGENISV